MNFKKLSGLIGVVLCVLLLVLVGVQVITWAVFWLAIIAIAGFAYFVLPRIRD